LGKASKKFAKAREKFGKMRKKFDEIRTFFDVFRGHRRASPVAINPEGKEEKKQKN